MREAEPVRLPTWRRVLEDYRRAFDRYHADPDSLPRTAFLDRAVQRLQTGLVALSQGAIRELVAGKHLAEELLIRHKNGDFGLMVPEDVDNNRYATPREYQATSRYETRAGSELWVSTYGNRSVTHLFTREEH